MANRNRSGGRTQRKQQTEEESRDYFIHILYKYGPQSIAEAVPAGL